MKTRKNVLLWCYRIALSLSIIIAGICLAAQCLLIYQSGAQPFTPETVAAAFSHIAVPVYICGALAVAGLLLSPLFPVQGRSVADKNYDLILQRLQQTTDLSLCPAEAAAAVLAQRASRKRIYLISLALLVLGSIIFLLFGADPAKFDQMEINASMLRAMYWLAGAMAVPFAFGIFAAYYRRSNIQKEIALLRSAPKEAKCAAVPAKAPSPGPGRFRWAILAAAVVMIVGGYLMSGAADVLTKAVNICTECIGLG